MCQCLPGPETEKRLKRSVQSNAVRHLGTLVDNFSIADVIEPYVFASHTAHNVAQDWRFQQKWAMFHLTLSDNFVPHPGVNEACLKWSLEHNGVEFGCRPNGVQDRILRQTWSYIEKGFSASFGKSSSTHQHPLAPNQVIRIVSVRSV